LVWIKEVREFLDEVRFGVLATINDDGSIQQTVMWYRREADTIVMNTRNRRTKERNLSRNPQASFCVEDGQRYVSVRGQIEIDYDPENGQSGMRKITTRYVGEQEAERQMREEYATQHRIGLTLIAMHVDAHGFD
jgi:PPOX class probable F420-dependent enzyme